MQPTRKVKVAVSIGAMFLISIMLLPGHLLATTVSGSSSVVTFNNAPREVTSVKVASPGGAMITSTELTVFPDEYFVDGDYQYELIGALPMKSPVQTGTVSDPVNGRGRVVLQPPVGVIESGDFRIVNGQVIDTRTLTEN